MAGDTFRFLVQGCRQEFEASLFRSTCNPTILVFTWSGDTVAVEGFIEESSLRLLSVEQGHAVSYLPRPLRSTWNSILGFIRNRFGRHGEDF